MKSALLWNLQKKFIAWFRSFILNKNSRDPRTDLWRPPQFIAARPSLYPFIDKYWLQLDR